MRIITIVKKCESVARIAAAATVILFFLGMAMVFDPLGKLIFFPDDYLVSTPKELGLDYEDVDLRTSDGGRTHAWLIPGPREEIVLWFHGNAGNISHRLDNIRLLHDRVGVSILIVDYGGYGDSDGDPSERRMYADARAARSFVVDRGFPTEAVIYFGRSLGSAVALDLALEHPPAKLILETPFESIRAMAATLVPPALARLVPQRFDNLSKIAELRVPVLFIHGDYDAIVPIDHGRALFAEAAEPKHFYEIHSATHNDTYIVGGEDYFAAWREFLWPGEVERAAAEEHERS